MVAEPLVGPGRGRAVVLTRPRPSHQPSEESDQGQYQDEDNPESLSPDRNSALSDIRDSPNGRDQQQQADDATAWYPELDRHIPDDPNFGEIVPPFHRQGNCIPSAGRRVLAVVEREAVNSGQPRASAGHPPRSGREYPHERQEQA